jgi:putative acetyltransferase
MRRDTSHGWLVKRFDSQDASAYLEQVRVRAFLPDDAPRLCEIFYRSVHEVASAKYDRAQLDAWAPTVPDAAKWFPSLAEYATFVALNVGDEPIAWISMTDAGYIDMLFYLPEAVGRGVAGRLYEQVERIARDRGLSRMTAHASLLAQPFFAKRGWRVEQHEMHLRNGVAIPRAEMSKDLKIETDDRPTIDSPRLRLSEFAMVDAVDVYNCISPAITRYMFWEPPSSFEAYAARREATLRSTDRNDVSLVIRRIDTMECLGIASLDGIDADAPELGVWLKEGAHGKGYGSEAVRAVADWASPDARQGPLHVCRRGGERAESADRRVARRHRRRHP